MSPVAHRRPVGRPASGRAPAYDSARHHAIAAAVACLLGAAAFALLPVYTHTITNAGTTSTTHLTGLAVNGSGVLVLALLPLALTLAAALVPRSARAIACPIAAALLTVFVAITAASIGIFLLPAACLLWLAAVTAWRERR